MSRRLSGPMHKRIALASVVVLLLPVVAAGCTSPPPSPQPPPPQSHTFTFNEWSFAFSLANISVNRGDSVTLIVTNNGTRAHDVTVETPYHVHIHLMANSTGSATFGASEAGAFEYYCSVAGHKDAGMLGTLTVR